MSKRNVIILGSGAAGYTAAIYTARAGLQPLLIDGPQIGGQLTITSDVENFPGFPKGVQGPVLMNEMRAQAEKFETEFVSGMVTKVDLSNKPYKVYADNNVYETETLIIATGASARWLGLESEKKLYGKGVSACATCDGFFFRNKVVAVVGGGDTALEEAAFLTRFAKEVFIIHRRDEFRGSKYMQEQAQKNPKISFVLNSVVEEILDPAKNSVTGIRLKDVKTGVVTEHACDGVFIAIGHSPNSDPFKGIIDTDANGYIKTTPGRTTTNIDGVFAAGDVADAYYRQAITAAGTGCMAAIEVERYLAGHK